MSQVTKESKPVAEPTGSKRFTAFIVAQLLIVGVAVAGVTYRNYRLEAKAELPPLRAEPLEIRPLLNPDDFSVLDEEQLRRALVKLRPVLNKDVGIAKVDHNLRFWGVQQKFADPAYCSGEQMRDVLLDHNAFRDLYGDEATTAKPFLIDVPETGGVRMRDFEGNLSSSHNDHTMACLAEVGTPLNYPVVTINHQTTFGKVVEQSLRDFSLNQLEYEWSALTYALFVKDTNRWMTSEGQEVSFDMLARRIMRQNMPQGVCFGNHRLHSLVMMLRVDEEWDGPTPMLSAEVRQEILDFLKQMTIKLIAHQHEDGFWNSDWPTAKPTSKTPTETEGDDLSGRVIATGHALEWWALLSESDRKQVLPEDLTMVRNAAQWLVRTIDELSEEDAQRYSAFLSHAGRALALWRGKFPHEVNLAEPTVEATSS